MRYSLLLCLLLASACANRADSVDSPRTETTTPNTTTPNTTTPNTTTPDTMSTAAAGFYTHTTSTLEGEPLELSEYAGKVTLVVNVASECGYTRQYSGLQALQDEFAARGFNVLGVPSNEFGGQEPGSPETIREFCTSRFNVTFPMAAKSEVKPGGGQSPLYSYLEQQTGKTPNWNFCKYLIGSDGAVIAFFPSAVAPDAEELRKAIETALG